MKRTWITVKRGILEPKHRFALGELIWLYIYILDLTNWEEGIIEDWLDRGAAEEMEMPLATLRDQRRKLAQKGYITCQEKQHGIRIIVHNWTNPKEYTGQKYNIKTPSDTLGDTASYIPSDTASFNEQAQNNVPSYSQKSKVINQNNILPEKESGKLEPEYEPFNNQADMPQSFVDEYTPKKIKKPKHQPDPRYTHIAYSAFYSVTKRRPHTEMVDKIIEVLGDTPDIDRLRMCYVEWIERGFNKMSYIWLTEWYKKGIPKPKNATNPKQDEYLERFLNGE